MALLCGCGAGFRPGAVAERGIEHLVQPGHLDALGERGRSSHSRGGSHQYDVDERGHTEADEPRIVVDEAQVRLAPGIEAAALDLVAKGGQQVGQAVPPVGGGVRRRAGGR